MNEVAMKKVALMCELSRVPEARLDEVMAYFEGLLADVPVPSDHKRSLKGIWKDSGFDKLADLECEIRNTRQEIQDAIMKRKL